MNSYFTIVSILFVFDICRGASPDNTIVPPASSIIDNLGNVWTLNNGYIYVNGNKRNDSSNVIELYWHNHTTYVGSYETQPGEITKKNTPDQYFKLAPGQYYEGFTHYRWVQCIDPRLGGTSTEGTTLNGTTGTYIIDKACNLWTLSNGTIYTRGPTDPSATQNPYASNVGLLLWYGGLIYYQSTGGQYYVQSFLNSSDWLPCTDPRIAKASNNGSFYGINGHWNYPNPPFSPAKTVALLKELNLTIYRTNVGSSSTVLPLVVNLAKEFQLAGLKLFPLLDLGPYTTPQVLYPTEEAAYNAGKADGVAVAAALTPYGVDTYECGNELTLRNEFRWNFNKTLSGRPAGTRRQDFNNTNWPIMRGLIRGLMDGIRSVQPAARCGVNFVLTDVAAADMLWDGKQPDGTSGHPQVRWNITTWHTYAPYGDDIFNSGIDDGGPGFNIPVYAKARYGVPFFITEWNALVNIAYNPSFTETDRATYIRQQLTEFYKRRNTEAIESTMLYELTTKDLNGLWWGILYGNLTKFQPMYDAFATVIRQYPDPESCLDASSDCSQYLGFCGNPSYHTLLCNQCRKSCKLCDVCD